MRLVFALNGINPRYNQVLFEKGVRNMLWSYAFQNSIPFEKAVLPYLTGSSFLIVDSGAFSAWTKNKQLDLDAYIAFCKAVKEISPCETHFVNLDVIPGSYGRRPNEKERQESAEKGWENYERMKAAGLKTIHIFHQHEDFEWLERLKASNDYIGISPANDQSIKSRLIWLKKVYGVVKQDVKTHIFGLTAYSILKEIPCYSADSSSWSATSRFGAILHYDGFKNQTFRFREQKKMIENGIDARVLDGDCYDKIRPNVDSMLRIEADITRLWIARGIVWRYDENSISG